MPTLLGTEKQRGGVASRSIAYDQIRPLHNLELSYQRYVLVIAGGPAVGATPGPTNTSFFQDGFCGGLIQANLSAAAAGAATLNFQSLPSDPIGMPLQVRNVTALGAVRGLGQALGGFAIIPTGLLTTESVELMWGGPSRTNWRNVDPASYPSTSGADKEFAYRVRMRNVNGFAASDLCYFGFGKAGTPATFEAYTDLVAFKLIKGATTEAQIRTVTRQASAAVVEVDSGLTVAANATTGQGAVELELRLRGRLGSVVCDFLVNGRTIKTVSLPTLAAGLYTPVWSMTAGAGTFNSVALERVEVGPREVMLRDPQRPRRP